MNTEKTFFRYASEEDREAWKTLDPYLSDAVFREAVREKRCLLETDSEAVSGVLRFGLFWDHIPFCYHLMIREDRRRSGNGRKLLAFWEDKMLSRGYDLVLTSTQSDEEGQYFYRACGYTDIGCFDLPFPGYEQPSELVLGKYLRPAGKE